MNRSLRWNFVFFIVLLRVTLPGSLGAQDYVVSDRPNVLKPGAVDVNDMGNRNLDPVVSYLDKHDKRPVEYVVEKFKKHDVVMLGEMHQQREVCVLFSKLIEPLYHQVGVRNIGIEVVKYKNTESANQLVTGETFDQTQAMNLYRDGYWPTWGFKEYLDILRSVWKLNQSLPPDAERFKVIGLAPEIDAFVTLCGSPEEKKKMEAKVFGSDKFMANIIAEQVLDKGEKAVVQIGNMHSFTHYRVPSGEQGTPLKEWPRMGCILHEEYGDRVFQIALHQDHFTADKNNLQPRKVLDGLMEAVMAQRGNPPVGFDVVGSPFENLRDRNSYYFAFQKYVVFSDIARGYIFIKPVKKLSKTTWVDGFIGPENFKRANGIAVARGWVQEGQCKTPQQLDARFKMMFSPNQGRRR